MVGAMESEGARESDGERESDKESERELGSEGERRCYRGARNSRKDRRSYQSDSERESEEERGSYRARRDRYQGERRSYRGTRESEEHRPSHQGVREREEAQERPRPSPDYLIQLMNDKKALTTLPNFCSVFTHLERLLDEEISRVRRAMYDETVSNSGEKRSLQLPAPTGPIVQLHEKLYVPVKEHPEFNFVGRILGPRGLTAKQLEAETGCRIMVRGRSSMRDKKKEELNRGKPNWEHLKEELHVLVSVEDTQNRAHLKLHHAVKAVRKLLVPAAEGKDSLKRIQLMELAILNGTYRDVHGKPHVQTPSGRSLPTSPPIGHAPAPGPILPGTIAAPASASSTVAAHHQQHRPVVSGLPPSPAVTAATLMPLIRPFQATAMLPPTPHAALVQPASEAGFLYGPFDYHNPYALTPATSIFEYPLEPSGVMGAVASKIRRADMRVHPYHRFMVADRAATGN
uniref:KH domain-containing RNA-binding protein QKI-like isoform X2 n=1 Tax=Myxine glutinosa TaxID=7769 RepID=UPI00358E5238